MGFRIGWRERDRSPIIRCRLVEFVALIMDDPDIVESRRKIRVDCERPTPRGERCVALTGETVHLAEIAVIKRYTSVGPHGAADKVDRLQGPCGVMPNDFEQMQGGRGIWLGSQDIAAQRLGLGQPAGLQILIGERHRLVEGQR